MAQPRTPDFDAGSAVGRMDIDEAIGKRGDPAQSETARGKTDIREGACAHVNEKSRQRDHRAGTAGDNQSSGYRWRTSSHGYTLILVIGSR